MFKKKDKQLNLKTKATSAFSYNYGVLHYNTLLIQKTYSILRISKKNNSCYNNLTTKLLISFFIVLDYHRFYKKLSKELIPQ